VRRRGAAALALGLAAALGGAAPARAETGPPPAAAQVGVEPRIGERVPLDLLFSEAGGRRVALGDLFGDGRPVLLILTYVRCESLCSLVLRGAIRAVSRMELVPGEDYRIVSVSIDPHEEAADAAARRRELVEAIGRPGEPERWTYLVGAERPIRALADALGFRYAWDERTEQYAHPAVLFVLTPDGRLSRALHGIDFDPATLETALASAGRGDVMSAAGLAEVVLRCFRFDPTRRIYRDRIRTYLRVGATTVFTLLGSLVVALFMWERRRARRARERTGAAADLQGRSSPGPDRGRGGEGGRRGPP